MSRFQNSGALRPFVRLLVLLTIQRQSYSGFFVQALSPSPTTKTSPPQWWSQVWDRLPPPGEPGSPLQMGDFLLGVRRQLEEEWFDVQDDTVDGENEYLSVPAANVDPSTWQTNFFSNIRHFRKTVGSIFSLNVGVTRITYVADLAVVKGILLRGGGAYDKGLLGFVGGDVFGEGLITALDREVWRRRRKAVAPTLGANQNFLATVIQDFDQCTRATFATLDQAAISKNSTSTVDLEETCLAIALDALGVTVFGTNFEAAQNIKLVGGDPLVKAVYRVLKETNIRAEKPQNIVAALLRPKWLAEFLSPDLKEFREASRLLDAKINELIADLKTSVEQVGDDTTTAVASPSILQVLVEARDGETTSQQVKDDLVTLLIAGHETVASVLTWALYELARNPDELKKVQAEIDSVLGKDDASRPITMTDIMNLECTRRALTESLRLYPAPPLLSRRALQDEILPLTDGVTPPLRLKRGDNIFLLTAMLHRDPRLYGDNAEVFAPDRWAGPILADPEATPNWNGYEGPGSDTRALYPSEKATDFALIGFGAGEFKCLGDKFAFVEATIVLARLLQRYEFDLVTEDVGFDMAGTIHTSHGLMARVRHRDGIKPSTGMPISTE